MGPAILGVIVLLFCVLAYFAARTWQAWQAVLVVFLFIGVLACMILTAATLRVQEKWRGRNATLTADIERLTEANDRLLNGSLVDDVMGLTQLRNAAQRLLVGRGRVWRGIRLANLGEGQLVFDTAGWTAAGCAPAAASDEDEEEVPADAEGEEGAPEAAAPVDTAATGLEVNSLVYAFKEAAIGQFPESKQQVLLGEQEQTDKVKACKVPYFYMGEYKVVAGEDNNPRALTLAPTMTLAEAQLQQLDNVDGTWVLYETMPIDSREAFADLTTEQIAELIATSDRDVIQSYARDLKPGTDTDPPDRTWVTFKFTQAHSEPVDVELPESAEPSPLADSLFDLSGRSLVATLSQGQVTEFAEGDEAIFDRATAERLASDGKGDIDVGKSIYRRQLRDYARYFRTYDASVEGLAREMAAAEADLAKLNQSLKSLQSQQEFQEANSEELQFDIAGLAKERQVLTSYLSALETKWNELRAELSRLYRTNRSLVSSPQ